jgi:hypothetical protein
MNTQPRIYGAGLLSSIGESYNCLQDHVKKIPYTIAAAHQDFDITTMQPQLFVTPDFKHLTDVLNEFADGMALRKGGSELEAIGIVKGNTISLKFESGITVEGTLKNTLSKDGKMILLSLANCTVRYKDQTLFRPEWGMYDMAVGEKITSVFSWPADPVAFGLSFPVPAEKTHKIIHNDKARKLHKLYHHHRCHPALPGKQKTGREGNDYAD